MNKNHINFRLSEKLKYMKGRCNNKNNASYEYYGGRGIIVSEEWNHQKDFIKWARENGYKEGLVIDRIDNDGNYEPSNCQWVTSTESVGIGKRRKPKTNKSGYMGVSYFKLTNKWRSAIKVNGKSIHLGFYKNIEDAVNARTKKEIELFGCQKTNFIKEYIMKLVALDSTKTITKGLHYYATKELDRFYKIMDDKGTIRLMLKSHFVRCEE